MPAESVPTAYNPRLDGIRAMWPHVKWTAPVPPDETRFAVAYDRDKNVIGRFQIEAKNCLAPDTITWRGYYWSLQLLAESLWTVYPNAFWAAFDDERPVSGIR